MENEMNIICLYWVGDFRERDYTVNDVLRLRQSVDKHITRPYKFYCLTNDLTSEIPAIRIPLKHTWPGWWAKMELHRPDLPKGRTLYLDLDSHVISNLDPILDYPGNLVMFDTKASKRKQENNTSLTLIYKYQAATMLFDPGAMKQIYKRFKKRPEFYMNKFRSDQDIMGEWISNQPVFPGEWMKKLVGCKGMTSPPKNVIIITGRPGDGSFRRLHEYPWLDKVAREQEGDLKCM